MVVAGARIGYCSTGRVYGLTHRNSRQYQRVLGKPILRCQPVTEVAPALTQTDRAAPFPSQYKLNEFSSLPRVIG